MAKRRGTVRIGTSGWIYSHWRGRFYSKDLRQSKWFTHYAQHFDTVEINNTFYRLPSETAFDAWRKQAPRAFIYAVKASRFLTHMKKLKDPEEPIERILGRARHLSSKLGPVLYQLPRGWRCNVERLRTFFSLLPRDLTHVMEYRTDEWLCDDVFAAMREFDIGLCIHDLVPNHPPIVTANTIYIRFHGATGKYAGSYSKSHLRRWADWIHQKRASGHAIYAYFNNDAEAHAIRNALTLRELVEANC